LKSSTVTTACTLRTTRSSDTFFLEVFSHHNVDLRNELEERDQGIIAVEPHSDAPDWQAPVAEKAPEDMTGDEKYMYELK